METVNVVKLVELYKEILYTYITKDGILKATYDMTDKDILDDLLIKNYIVKVISTIEDEFIEQGKLVVTGSMIYTLIQTIQLNEDFIKHPCLFKILYTLYSKIIHLKQKD